MSFSAIIFLIDKIYFSMKCAHSEISLRCAYYDEITGGIFTIKKSILLLADMHGTNVFSGCAGQ